MKLFRCARPSEIYKTNLELVFLSIWTHFLFTNQCHTWIVSANERRCYVFLVMWENGLSQREITLYIYMIISLYANVVFKWLWTLHRCYMLLTEPYWGILFQVQVFWKRSEHQTVSICPKTTIYHWLIDGFYHPLQLVWEDVENDT